MPRKGRGWGSGERHAERGIEGRKRRKMKRDTLRGGGALKQERTRAERKRRTEAERFLHGGGQRDGKSVRCRIETSCCHRPGRQPDYCTEPPWTMDARGSSCLSFSLRLQRCILNEMNTLSSSNSSKPMMSYDKAWLIIKREESRQFICIREYMVFRKTV